MMTCPRMSVVSRLRIEEMERSALRVKRASNRVTARSKSAKLLLMSAEVVIISSSSPGKS